MTHFTLWEWADFVRSLSASGVHTAMNAHLTDCPRCQRTVEMLRAVADVARREKDYEPPDHAIRYAQAIYSLYRPEKSGLARLMAHLVHDSAMTPLPAGIRSQASMSRHLVFQADSYYLDLQLEYQPSGRVTLIGQLASKDSLPVEPAEVPVYLTEGSMLMATTRCNPLGEFHLECSPSRDLRLHLALSEAGKELEVALSDLHPDYRKAGQTGKIARHRQRRRPSNG